MKQIKLFKIAAVCCPLCAAVVAGAVIRIESRRENRLQAEHKRLQARAALLEQTITAMSKQPHAPRNAAVSASSQEQPDFLKTLRACAMQRHIQVARWSDTPAIPAGSAPPEATPTTRPAGVTALTSQMETRGNYNASRLFLYDLLRSARLFTLNDIKCARGEHGKHHADILPDPLRNDGSGDKLKMKTLAFTPVLLSALGLLAQGACAAEKPGVPASAGAVSAIRLNFARADAGIVLSTLGTRTHTNIIYSASKPREISIRISVPSLEEALRSVAATAGLEYRQVGRSYVVAAPEDLRQALKPFAASAFLIPTETSPVEMTKLVEASLPYLTVRVVGNRLLVSGAESDIAQAQALVAAPPKSPDAPMLASAVMPVQNVSATQVALVLKSMYPGLQAEAVGTAEKVGGAVGVSGSLAQVASAKATVQALDVPSGPQASGREVRIYQIRFSSAPSLRAFLANAVPEVGVIVGPEAYAPNQPNFRPLTGSSTGLVSGTGGSGASGGGTNGSGGASSQPAGDSVVLDKSKEGQRAKSLVLSGAPQDLDTALKLLQQLDIAPQQVMVEVKVVDTSPQFAEELGVRYSFAPVAIGNAAPGTQIDPATGLATTSTALPFNFATFSRLGLGVGALLNAVKTRSDTKLLADPRVQVLDNEDANIFIGDTVRTQVSQSSLSGTTIQVLEFPVGIILLVRPRVNSDGKITMRVHPVVSTITGFGAGNLPQSSSREVETTVMMQDGETIVLGGLIRDEYSKIVQEVPLLSKIPLLGELFRNRSTNHRRSDVMVFITPHIVKSP